MDYLMKYLFGFDVLLAMLLLLGGGAAAPASAAADGIPNGSFEREGDRGPEGWRPQSWGGRGEFEYVHKGRTGGRSAALRSDQGADVSRMADVRLDPIGRAAPAEWRITVHASQTGEPLSEYVYGQFIEHLGRCIYGGIWAEMLEDRKFFFPVIADYQPYRALQDSPHPVVGASPWQIVGSADSVTMVTEAPFVGEHTPQVAAGSGLRQRDLGLVRDQVYEGYLWLKAPAGAAQVDVALCWGEPSTARESVRIDAAPGPYRQYPFQVTAGTATDQGALEILVRGNPVRVGTVSLMPADNVHGMRADTLALLKQLNSPIYRWPGGNFVSGYDWQDGIGPRDQRPPRANPAWTGVEHNDFGLDEFIRFCRLLEAAPYIAVNSGLGGVERAAQEVEYANGPATSPMGKRRADNGNPEPYRVKFWGIGNEMYGDWQLGHMPLRTPSASRPDYMRWPARATCSTWPTMPKRSMSSAASKRTRRMLRWKQPVWC